jgi:hypothetical protein
MTELAKSAAKLTAKDATCRELPISASSSFWLRHRIDHLANSSLG